MHDGGRVARLDWRQEIAPTKLPALGPRSKSASMFNQNVFVVLINWDFLKFSRLLAANTVSRLKRRDITRLAVIAHGVQFAVMHRVHFIDLEVAVRKHLALEANFVILKPLILERMKDVRIPSSQRILLALNLQDGAGSGDCDERALQNLLTGINRRSQHWAGEQYDPGAKQQACNSDGSWPLTIASAGFEPSVTANSGILA